MTYSRSRLARELFTQPSYPPGTYGKDGTVGPSYPPPTGPAEITIYQNPTLPMTPISGAGIGMASPVGFGPGPEDIPPPPEGDALDHAYRMSLAAQSPTLFNSTTGRVPQNYALGGPPTTDFIPSRDQFSVARPMPGQMPKTPADTFMSAAMQPAPISAAELAEAVIAQESTNNPRARNRETGATGLMQLMPATAQEVANRLGIQGPLDLTDPELNRQLGTAYLQTLLDKYQDPRLALTAYQSGPGNVDKWRAEHGPTFEDIQPHLRGTGAVYANQVLGRYQSGLG